MCSPTSFLTNRPTCAWRRWKRGLVKHSKDLTCKTNQWNLIEEKRLSISLVPSLWGTMSQWVKTDRWVECRSIPVLSSFRTARYERHQFEFSKFNGLPLKRPLIPKLFSYISALQICHPPPYFPSARIHQKACAICCREWQGLKFPDRPQTGNISIWWGAFITWGKNNSMWNDCKGMMRCLLGWNTVQGAWSSAWSVEQCSNYNLKWRQGN